MQILSAEQVRAADQYTIEHEPIASIDLMERASKAFVEEFVKFYDANEAVSVFCGTGNNGGDGLAIARLLHERGYSVQLWVCGPQGKGSPDFLSNYERLPIQPNHIIREDDFPVEGLSGIVIDGLFGSGLNRPLAELPAQLVQHINQLGLPIVSVDVASGLFIDQAVEKGSAIIRPERTFSFQLPKLVFFQPALVDFVGEWHVLDIQLNEDFLSGQPTPYLLTEADEMSRLIPTRDRFAHKGDAGRVALWAGSADKMGAALLAAKACLRTGPGLLWMLIPKEGLTSLNVSVPEAMWTTFERLLDEQFQESLQVLGIGPGLGTDDEQLVGMKQLFRSWRKPAVLDADAITLISMDHELEQAIPKGSILTPHPGEFHRLVGGWHDDYHKLELLRRYCREHEVNIVLKGAYSAVCDAEGRIFFNPTGNPGMATGGTGDVLFGMTCGLLAQGLTSFDALRLAVYLHGKAGDLAKDAKGIHSLMASDLIDQVPNSFM